MDQKTKPWAFPKPHPENTLAANATSKSSMLRQTPGNPRPRRVWKRPARRQRTLIVRARHHASRAGRGIRSPGSHPPRRPAVRQAPRTRPHLPSSDAQAQPVGARLRSPHRRKQGELSIRPGPAGPPDSPRVRRGPHHVAHPGIALMPDHGKLPDAGQERRLHRLEICLAGQRRGAVSGRRCRRRATSRPAATPPPRQHARCNSPGHGNPRRARPLAARRTPCGGPPPRSRPAGSARRHRGLDGWRRPSGPRPPLPRRRRAARHIDLGRGRRPGRRGGGLHAHAKLLSGWPGVQAMKPAARNTRS